MQRRGTLLIVFVTMLTLLVFRIPEAAAQRPTADDSPVSEAAVNVAKAAQAKHQRSILKRSGVRGVGVGLMDDGKRVGIHIFVRKGERTEDLPKELDGVPVKIVEAGAFKAHNGPCDVTDCHTAAVALPAQMGNSTGNENGEFAGTLGYRVFRRGNSSNVGYIVPNHVGAATGPDLCPAQINPENLAAFETPQCQPGLFDSGGSTCVPPPIGNLVQVIPLVMGGDFLNTVDAAFVESSRACVSKTIRDIGNPTSTAAFPALNSILKLSGRTSGLRTVKVAAINVTIDVDYGSACGTARFVNQAVTVPTGVLGGSSASRPGDSGAPVVTSKRQAVGMNYAGDGFYGIIEPMPLVLDALGVQIDTGSDAPGSGC
jgi:hypothetical protein